MWDLPGPGIEPMSPALAGGFLTTVPPGKPYKPILNLCCNITFHILSVAVQLILVYINQLMLISITCFLMRSLPPQKKEMIMQTEFCKSDMMGSYFLKNHIFQLQVIFLIEGLICTLRIN